MDIDEWQQHITIDAAITSTDDTAITFIVGMATMSTGARAITSIGRITHCTIVGPCIMCIGHITACITDAKAITSSGTMCIVGVAIISIVARDTTFTGAKACTCIEDTMQCRDIVRIMRVGPIRGRHA